MTSKQSSYYDLEDQYGWRSRYPYHDIRSSDLSLALSSSHPRDSYKPLWNSNYPMNSNYVHGASTAIQAPEEHLYYSNPLSLNDSSSASTNNSLEYNYPATIYGCSVYDYRILKIITQNAHTKLKELQATKPVMERLNEEPSKISGVVGDYDYFDVQDFDLKPQNEKSLITFSTYDNYVSDRYRFRPRNHYNDIDGYRFRPRNHYNDTDGAYGIDEYQRLLNPFDYSWGRYNKQEDQTYLKRLQGYSGEDQQSLEDGGRQDLWNVYSKIRCKRAVSNCYDYDDYIQDFGCDYEIEYDCFDDDGDLLNPYRTAKRQKTAPSSYDSSDCSDYDL